MIYVIYFPRNIPGEIFNMYLYHSIDIKDAVNTYEYYILNI